jgi:hypothetical protein
MRAGPGTAHVYSSVHGCSCWTGAARDQHQLSQFPGDGDVRDDPAFVPGLELLPLPVQPVVALVAADPGRFVREILCGGLSVGRFSQNWSQVGGSFQAKRAVRIRPVFSSRNRGFGGLPGDRDHPVAGALPRVSGTWARHPRIGSLWRCHGEACAPEGLKSR